VTEPSDSPSFSTVDAAMQSWRQGDIAQLDIFWHLADFRRPVTSASIALKETSDQPDASGVSITTAVDGLVILTQTCDIRRKSFIRPYVEVCPLVRVDPSTARAVSKREIPRYAAVPALGDDAVADLDRVMTMEKGWLSFAVRITGWTTDNEIRRFQAAVARRYQRFAFPDDFSKSVAKLREKIIDRHGKQTSPEGQLFAKVMEIRVAASPHWASDDIEATLVFILPGGTLGSIPDELADTPHLLDTLKWLSTKSRTSTEVAERILSESDPISAGVLWKRVVEAWAQTCRPMGCISVIHGEAVDADEYPVGEYWMTEQLDLDHLSDDSSEAIQGEHDTRAAQPEKASLRQRIRSRLRFPKHQSSMR
jgi:hypothetical protein